MRFPILFLFPLLAVIGCDGGGGAGDTGADGGVLDAPDALTGDPCVGNATFPPLPAGTSAANGLASGCAALVDDELLIYVNLKGFEQDGFAPPLQAVLERAIGAPVALVPAADGFDLAGQGPTGITRAHAAWQDGITHFLIGVRAGDGALQPKHGDVEKAGPTPCFLPQAEIDLCRRSSLKSLLCDALPAATDGCREIVALITGASCEQGPECGLLETCQNGICCRLGTLACGEQCYDPNACQTCRDNRVVNRGGVGTGLPGPDCDSCHIEGVFGGVVCRCQQFCPAEECCPDGEAGQCVDKQTDAKNCGGCGRECAPGEDCRFGACNTQRCPANEVPCGAQCCREGFACAEDTFCCGPCAAAETQCPVADGRCGYACCPPGSAMCCPGRTPDQLRCCTARGCGEPGFCL